MVRVRPDPNPDPNPNPRPNPNPNQVGGLCVGAASVAAYELGVALIDQPHLGVISYLGVISLLLGLFYALLP